MLCGSYVVRSSRCIVHPITEEEHTIPIMDTDGYHVRIATTDATRPIGGERRRKKVAVSYYERHTMSVIALCQAHIGGVMVLG
jgi:hypothetical protein